MMRHWTLVVLAVLVTASAVGLSVSFSQARSDRDRQARQFCEAIPNAAAAGAQALVNVIVAQDRTEGESEAKIKNTIELGRLYVAEARRLARADLPDCDHK
jgi:hypothetical protein